MLQAIGTIYRNFTTELKKQEIMFPYEALVEYRKCVAWPSRMNKIYFEAVCTKYMNKWADENGTGDTFYAIMSAQKPEITVKWPRSCHGGSPTG